MEGSQPSETLGAQDLKPLASSGTGSHVRIHACLHIVRNNIKRPFERVLLNGQDASEDKASEVDIRKNLSLLLRTHMLKGENRLPQVAL